MQEITVETNRLELDDLIVQYPPPSIPGFSARISNKEEFAMLKSTIDEPLPTKIGEYFKHQKFTHTFLKNINGNLLIMDETGTGKSASVLGYTEYCLTERQKMLNKEFDYDEKNAHYKRVVFVGQPLQKLEFVKQLSEKIAPDKYGPDPEIYAMDKEEQRERALRKSVKNKIDSNYDRFSYHDLSKIIDNSKEEELIERFSNCIIWMDEAHFFVFEKSKKATDKSKNKIYENIKGFLHKLKNTKVILTTATPIINKTSDIINILNLILPKDGEYPPFFDPETISEEDRATFFGANKVTPERYRGQIPEDFFKTHHPMSIEQLEPYLRGRITYIRAGNIGVNIRMMGHQINPAEIKGSIMEPLGVVWISEMSDHQNEAYEKLQRRNEHFGLAKTMVSNFVFPDGEHNNTKNKYYATTEHKGDKIIKGTPEFLKHFRNKSREQKLEQIREYSSKYASIIEEIDSVHRSDRPDGPSGPIHGSDRLDGPKGCAFVFGTLIAGVGNDVLSLCFDIMGYERFYEENSLFITKNNVKTIRHSFTKKKRYAIFSSETNKNIVKKILEVMTSPENADGEYIKVLIVSGAGGVGINISSVLQIHIIGPEWNEAIMYQAMSRALRADSYTHLQKKYPGEQLNVKIYRHASKPQNSPGYDLYTYVLSEYKDRKNKQVYRMLKQCAIGAIINKERNILPTDEDNSAVCDYMSCDYEAFDQDFYDRLHEDGNDYSTFDVLYARNNILNIIDIIGTLYYHKNSYNLDEIELSLHELMKTNIRRSSIILALEYIINHKIQIVNRFGYKCFLLEDKNNFYLDINYPNMNNNYLQNFYSSNLITIKREGLEKIYDELYEQQRIIKIEELEANITGGDGTAAVESVGKLQFDEKLALLEKTLTINNVQAAIANDNTNFIKQIIEIFSIYLFVLPKYSTTTVEVAVAGEVAAEPKKKRGRPPTKNKTLKDVKLDRVKLKDVEYNEETIRAAQDAKDIFGFFSEGSGDAVLVHTFMSTKPKDKEYGTTTNILKGAIIRILDNNKWRDPSEQELIYYNKQIQTITTILIVIPRRTEATTKSAGIYGTRVIEKGELKFKIADVGTEKGKSGSDTRALKEGRVCTTFHIPEILDLMWRVGYSDDAISGGGTNVTGSNGAGGTAIGGSIEGASAFPILPEPKVSIGKMRELVEKNIKDYDDNWEDDRVIFYYKFLSLTGKNKKAYKIGKPDLCDRLDAFLQSKEMVFEL